MKTMTFVARELRDALKEVRLKLGPDALIVSTQKVPPLLGLGPPMLEVTAAVPENAEAPARPTVMSRLLNRAAPPKATPAATGQTRAIIDDTAPIRPAAPAADEAEAALQAQLLPLQREVRALRSQLLQVAKSGNSSLQREVEELRAVLRTMDGERRSGEVTPELARLLNLGIDRQRAEALLLRARELAEGSEGLPLGKALRRAVTERVAVAGPVGVSARVAAFVGPTGVGKTTTIAKIAARAALIDGAKVSLITIDTFRVGAIDQLQRYADLMELPLQVAGTSAALRAAVQSDPGADLILVDTAGRGPRDVAQLAALREVLGSADGVEVHLCLSATTRSREQALALSSYRALSPSRLCITKLDEAISVGELLNLLDTSRLPLSYFGTGQRVPEDLELCTPEGFADRLLQSVVTPPKDDANGHSKMDTKVDRRSAGQQAQADGGSR